MNTKVLFPNALIIDLLQTNKPHQHLKYCRLTIDESAVTPVLLSFSEAHPNAASAGMENRVCVARMGGAPPVFDCGKNVIIKDRCYFGDGHRMSLGDRSQLGQNSRLQGTITIGDDCVMGPESS